MPLVVAPQSRDRSTSTSSCLPGTKNASGSRLSALVGPRPPLVNPACLRLQLIPPDLSSPAAVGTGNSVLLPFLARCLFVQTCLVSALVPDAGPVVVSGVVVLLVPGASDERGDGCPIFGRVWKSSVELSCTMEL